MPSLTVKKRSGQLFISHYPYEVVGNVFMRGETYPGLGLTTYKNTNTLIQGNYLGSPNELANATGYIDKKTTALVTKLQEMVTNGDINIDGNQGNFITGWVAPDGLKNVTFKGNYFSGNTLSKLYNPQTGAFDLNRDHNVYIKQYQDVNVIQNYFSGWPKDASGHLKFRNAEGLTFAANYLNGISFNARPYDNSPSMFMNKTYVFNNVVNNGQINFWQNFTDEAPLKQIAVTDFLVFDNLLTNTTTAQKNCAISSTYRNTSQQFFESQNYYDSGELITACYFKRISKKEIKDKLPIEKRAYLNIQAIIPGSANQQLKTK